jgi:hypothetical protein
VRPEIGWTAHWENSLKEIDEKIALLSGGISSYGLHPWAKDEIKRHCFQWCWMSARQQITYAE